MVTSATASIVALAAALAPTPPDESLRYDLGPGDHLVFDQTVRRVVESNDARFETLMRFESHVLVTGEERGSLRVGIQRNRVSAELLRYAGKHRGLEKERAAFAARVAQMPTAFTEANWFTRTGDALLPVSALREARSELLPHIRELPPLPPVSLAARDRWRSPGALGLSFQASGSEAIEGESCRRFDGTGEGNTLRVGLWFCEASESVARLVYEGTYATPPSSNVRETVRIERRERRRGEGIGLWLAEKETREGTLAAFLVSDLLPVEPASLQPLLESDVPGVQRKALAVLHRLRLPAPALDLLGSWMQAPDPRLRALAVRNLERVPDEAARPRLEGAQNDPASFVASAAVAGLRRFHPPPGAALVGLARGASGLGPRPAWSCRDIPPDWADQAFRAERRSGQVPGATLRVMTSAPFAGWPYVLYVPEDYRGDEPFPLVIVLGGGPGKAIPTVQGMRDSLESRGFLGLFPQARGSWWDKASISAVRVLLDEVLESLNVDPNRVYLTGFSNGGTGTFLYSTLWPHRLAAAASLMGGGLPFFIEEAPATDNLRALPMLFVHGEKDEVIPMQATVATVKAIKRLDASAPVESHILAGRGHDIVVGGDDGLTLPFFEARKRDPFPRRVRFATRSLEFARAFWIDIAAKDGGQAEVQGEIGPDNAITVTTRRVTRLRVLLRRELLADGAPVVVRWNGREAFRGPFQEDCGLLASTWRQTRDPFLAHSFEVDLDATVAPRAEALPHR
jgi:dienelactone hydrolase